MRKLIYRPIVDKIYERLGKNRIIVLIGARQVGKTSIMQMLGERLKADDPDVPLLFYDCEKVEYREIFSNYDAACAFLKGNVGNLEKRFHLFLDEFQKVPKIGNTLKLFADHHENITIVASGSSSLEIKKQLKESLAGRKRVIEVWPLSFEELLHFAKHEEADSYKSYAEDPRWEIYPLYREAFDEYAIYGGLPRIPQEPVFEEKKQELKEIYSSYLQKDIKSFIDEEKVVPFNKLLKLLAAQVGNLFSIEELAQTVRLKRDEVEEYLYILEQTYIIFLLSPFHSNLRKELTKKQKIYFYDIGLRNIILNNFADMDARPDGGHIFENCIIAELKKNSGTTDQFFFWQTQQGTEVDLIVKREGKIIPVEIKSRITSLRKLRGLKSFCAHYEPDDVYVVTGDLPERRSEEITFVPPCFARHILREV